MSDAEETSSVRVVAADTGVAEADLTAVGTQVEGLADAPDCHVITLRGADGWQLDHPQCPVPADCRFTEAAGRVSRAFCETLGRWTCDVQGGGLMLVERLGD